MWVVFLSLFSGVPFFAAAVLSAVAGSWSVRGIVAVLGPTALAGSVYLGWWRGTGYLGLAIILFAPLILSAWVLGLWTGPSVRRLTSRVCACSARLS